MLGQGEGDSNGAQRPCVRRPWPQPVEKSRWICWAERVEAVYQERADSSISGVGIKFLLVHLRMSST
jgi:hypothetical protein